METSVVTTEEKNSTIHTLSVDYGMIADLFIYPHYSSHITRVREIHQHLLAALPEAAEAMNRYMTFINQASLTDIQELYLRSFDVQAITTLDIGFILFGEDYKRGQLLVHLNREHREAKNVCETELSDHLPNVLRLLPKLSDIQLREEMALMLIIPAVEKMIGEFDNKKVTKKDEVYKKHLKTVIEYSQDYRTVYQSLLQALFIMLTHDFGYIPIDELTQETKTPEAATPGMACGSCSHDNAPKDFGGNIENELNIEQ